MKVGNFLAGILIVVLIGLSGCAAMDRAVYDNARVSRMSVGAGLACGAIASMTGNLGKILGAGIACGAIANMLAGDDCTQNVVYSPVRNVGEAKPGGEYRIDVGVAGHCITAGNTVEVRYPIKTGDNVVINQILPLEEFFQRYPYHPARGNLAVNKKGTSRKFKTFCGYGRYPDGTCRSEKDSF